MKEATLDKALHLSISNETWVFSPDTLPSSMFMGVQLLMKDQVVILKGGARGGGDGPE